MLRELTRAVALVGALGACNVSPPAETPQPGPVVAPPVAVTKKLVKVVALSDIHFDPFFDPSLVPELVAAPADKWPSILARSPHAAEVGSFMRETSYALWRSTLAAMSAAAPDAEAVLITGDFVAHKFGPTYAKIMAGKPGEADLPSFLDKTIAMLGVDLRAAFPHAQILPAIGNNDAPCGNYMSEPDSPFLVHLAEVFAPNAPADLVKQFSVGGYYAVSLRFAPKLRVIVLNSSYWSAEYKNKCGKQGDDAPGAAEMKWLEGELAGVAQRGDRAWVMSHIPVGLDLFMTMRNGTNPCGKDKYVSMYKEAWSKAYVSTLERYAPSIGLSLSGHTHNHELHVVGARGPNPVAVVTLPAVSTIYRNHPSFGVLEVDPDTLTVRDFALHALDYPKDGGAVTASAWRVLYDFDRDYGATELSGRTVAKLAHDLRSGPALRAPYVTHFTGGSGVPNLVFEDWATYACAMTNLDAATFEACRCR